MKQGFETHRKGGVKVSDFLKKLRDYVDGKSNVLILEEGYKLKTTRDVTPNGMEYIEEYIIEESTKREYFFRKMWHNPKEDIVKDKTKSKNTGGKQPYFMVMINEVEKLKKLDIKDRLDITGFVTIVGKNIEWNTGRLINVRSKKQLQYKDLIKITGCGKTKLDRILNTMKDNNLLTYEKPSANKDGGYFVSSNIIKKGNMKGVIEDDQ